MSTRNLDVMAAVAIFTVVFSWAAVRFGGRW
jgi:hypothetical protein